MMLSPGLRANTLLLPASLNLANAQDWKERLIAALTLTPILNLDGSETTHVTTPGIQILLAAAQSAKSKGGKIVLMNPSSALEAAFDDLGLTHTLQEWREAHA
ncbi:MAG: STAS domain-containing protein [Rhodomicrobium sp.]